MSYASPYIDPTAELSRKILEAALKAGYGRPVVDPNAVIKPASPEPKAQLAAKAEPKAP